MPNLIPLNDWLKFIDDEYLSQFISSGGASVKFAVTPEELRAELTSAVRARCEERGYIFIHLDAGAIRAHMPQDIFFGMASQVDWRLLARRRVLSLAQAKQYKVDGINPKVTDNIFEAIASANNLGLEYFREIRMQQEIENRVFKNTDLAKDFRVAMSKLCDCESVSGEYTGQPVLDWLTGETSRVSGIRLPIYTAINRSTARYFIESALHWIRHTGYAGTVILFDNSRVTQARNPRDEQLYYTKPMTMDHYELMREFIDEMDQLAGTLMLVMTSEGFLDDSSGRSYKIYQALRTRVMNDVYDRHLVNPIASLVQLS